MLLRWPWGEAPKSRLDYGIFMRGGAGIRCLLGRGAIVFYCLPQNLSVF